MSTDAAPLPALLARTGDAWCAFPARSVVEVFPLGSWTPMPGLPPFVIGVVARRGAAYAVLDLAVLDAAMRGEACPPPALPRAQSPAVLLRTASAGLVVPVAEILGVADVVGLETDPDPLLLGRATSGEGVVPVYDPERIEASGKSLLRTWRDARREP